MTPKELSEAGVTRVVMKKPESIEEWGEHIYKMVRTAGGVPGLAHEIAGFFCRGLERQKSYQEMLLVSTKAEGEES